MLRSGSGVGFSASFNTSGASNQVIPAGSRVMIIYEAANRGERRFPNPEVFDLTPDARSHLAWAPARTCASAYT